MKIFFIRNAYIKPRVKKNTRCPLMDFHVSRYLHQNLKIFLGNGNPDLDSRRVRLLLNFVSVGCLVNVVDNTLTSISFNENISSLSQTGNCWATVSQAHDLAPPLLY